MKRGSQYDEKIMDREERFYKMELKEMDDEIFNIVTEINKFLQKAILNPKDESSRLRIDRDNALLALKLKVRQEIISHHLMLMIY
jgi:hypothetical protein